MAQFHSKFFIYANPNWVYLTMGGEHGVSDYYYFYINQFRMGRGTFKLSLQVNYSIKLTEKGKWDQIYFKIQRDLETYMLRHAKSKRRSIRSKKHPPFNYYLF